MSKRHDNTSRASEFICLRCLSKNQVGDKIRRPNMREKLMANHIFTMYMTKRMNVIYLNQRLRDLLMN